MKYEKYFPENMSHLWQAFFLAKEMGKKLA